MARSSLIAFATFGSVAVAAFISLVWFAVATGENRFEPAVGVLGMLGGLTGILAERRAAARDRRRVVLATLADELERASAVLTDPRLTPSGDTGPRVYPRLPVSAIEAALTSGALTERGDTELLNHLHRWRDEAIGFNRRLEITEMRLLGAGAAHEALDFERALHRNGGYLSHIRTRLQTLTTTLPTHPNPT